MKKVEVSPALARKVAANTAAISDTREDICYIVDGDQSEVTIPSGSIFRLINSTVTGRSDGLYTSAAAIPASTSIDATYFNESAPLSGGVSNLLNSNITNLTNNKLLGGVDITGYTSSNKYTFPSDGYVDLYGGGSGQAIRAVLCGSDETTELSIYQAGSEHYIIFVKAGMKAYKVSATSENPVMAFKALG